MLSLQDESDIAKVIHAYATGIDARDYKLFRTCFTDDADCDYAPTVKWKSGDAITASMEKQHEPLGYTLHRITNIVIKPAAEGATARSYVHAVLMEKDGTLNMNAHGMYDDVFVRAGGGWKIKKRLFTLVKFEGKMPDFVKKG